jgi:uncharacterized protein
MANRPRLYSPYDAPMWDSISSGRMQLQTCDDCHVTRYPPGPACPKCLSLRYHWEDIAGKGRVLSWTTFHREYLPAYPAPHTVVAVELDEGPIMIGYVVREEVDKLAINSAVQLQYGRHPDGYAITYFTLDPSAD